jgi:hypothetical protein
MKNKARQFFFLLFLVFALAETCHASSIILNGVGNIFPIRRSRPETPYWSSSSGMTLATENTEGSFQKIVVEGSGINPLLWQGRYMRIRVEVPMSWLLVSPTAYSATKEIVADGALNGAQTLIYNLAPGTYPPADLFYEGRADPDAPLGDATVTITFTMIAQS